MSSDNRKYNIAQLREKLMMDPFKVMTAALYNFTRLDQEPPHVMVRAQLTALSEAGLEIRKVGEVMKAFQSGAVFGRSNQTGIVEAAQQYATECEEKS
jgi:hypothetical protein